MSRTNRLWRFAGFGLLFGVAQTCGVLYLFGCAWTNTGGSAVTISQASTLFVRALFVLAPYAIAVPRILSAASEMTRDNGYLLAMVTALNIALWTAGIAAGMRAFWARMHADKDEGLSNDRVVG